MNEPFKEPVLFNGKIDDDINLSMPPATGEEYIKRVILEARQCEEVVCAKIDEERIRKPTLTIEPLPECTKAPEYIGPTLEWQKHQVANFSNIRLYVAQIKSEITLGKRKVTPLEIELPDINDQNGWINLCTATSEENSSYIEPKLTVILAMNQPLIQQVLEYLVEFLNEQKLIELPLGRWLYGLLTALELPLHPDMCSCLRSLARACSTIRSQLDPSSAKDAIPLNLFISIVARYFRQLDLADP